jgi:hypothetical protein
MTCNPPPLAQVKFRESVRPLMWQLLGPAPEQEDAFYRHPDGTPRERPKKEKKQSFTEELTESQLEPKREARKSDSRMR